MSSGRTLDQQIGQACEKLKECEFFLRLLEYCEISQVSLVPNFEVDACASYFFTAFAGACHSVGLYLVETAFDGQSTKAIKDWLKVNLYEQAAWIHNRAAEGGVRNQSVHTNVILLDSAHYIQPPGDQVLLKFRDPYIPPDGDKVCLPIGEDAQFYLNDEVPQLPLIQRCREHLSALPAIIKRFEKEWPNTVKPVAQDLRT